MSNTTSATPAFVIEDFEAETAENPYTEHVAALVQAGEGKALTITADKGTKRDGSEGDGSRARLQFQSAANAAGYTARVRKSAENESDSTKINLTFTLGKINGRAGKPRPVAASAEADAAAAADPFEA